MKGEIVILTLVVFVWVGTLAQAEEQPVGMSHSSDMIGKLVKNLDGKNVGKIRDLVISWRSDGYIEYAVLSSGGFWGLEDESSIAVPWGALTPSDNKECFVLNVKQEHLKDVPGFVMYRFYDRSSAVANRGGRSAVVSSTPMMKGGIRFDVNVSVARSFDRPYAMAAESSGKQGKAGRW